MSSPHYDVYEELIGKCARELPRPTARPPEPRTRFMSLEPFLNRMSRNSARAHNLQMHWRRAGRRSRPVGEGAGFAAAAASPDWTLVVDVGRRRRRRKRGEKTPCKSSDERNFGARGNKGLNRENLAA